MKNYTEYEPPLTEGCADDHVSTGSCLAKGEGAWPYLCTRSAGHAGRHEAEGGRHQVFASWEDDDEIEDPASRQWVRHVPAPAGTSRMTAVPSAVAARTPGQTVSGIAHIVECHNDDRALCGWDVSDEPWDNPDDDDCAACADLVWLHCGCECGCCDEADRP